MKIIIFGLGSRGDVIPAVALAKKMIMTGLNVEVVVYPPFKNYVEREGVACKSVCTDEQYSDMVSRQIGLTNAQYCLHHWQVCHQHSVKPIFEYLSKERNLETLIVLAQEWCVGAVWACETHNIPLFTLSIGSHDMLTTVGINELKQTTSDRDEENKLINRIRENMKLPKKISDVEDVSIGKVCLYPKFIISALIDRGALENKTGKTFLIDRDDIIAANQCRHQNYTYDILYTCGTAFSPRREELEAFSFLCRAFKKKGVFIKGDSTIQMLKDDYVEVVEYIDIPAVLENASLIIHHGGIGTASDAVNGGVAQLIIPRAFDQFINAEIIESHGLGAKLDHKDLYYNSKALIEAAKNMLERKDEIKEAAKTLQKKRVSTSSFSDMLDSFQLVESASLIRRP